VCRWQVKLCDSIVTHGPYLSALAVVLPIIRRYTNHQITLTAVAELLVNHVCWSRILAASYPVLGR